MDQSFKEPYEIILVDSSYDATPEIVSRLFSGVTLIHLDKKTDPGSARNIGIKQSKGDPVLFIDADCIADATWIEKMLARHREGHMVVGGAVENGNGPGDAVALAGYMAEFREFLPEHPGRMVPHVPTCNISYKREVFSKYGFFDKDYYPQEDMLYNYHLMENGIKILFSPDIRVRHIHRVRLKDFFGHQRKIGSVTPSVIDQLNLPGAFLARDPFVALLLGPVLPLVKFIRTLGVFLRFRAGTLFRQPAAVVLFAAGLGAWITGFIGGVWHNKKYKEQKP
jgi:glycosyltransferase involved in cell wall biosynthesis